MHPMYSLPGLALLPLMLAAASANTDTQITLYSGDFGQVANSPPSPNIPGLALIRQTRPYELKHGNNEIAFDQLPLALDVGSVQLSPGRPGTQIIGQRYDLPSADPEQLLRNAVGQRIIVEHSDGGTLQRHSGTLLTPHGHMALLQDDGRVRVISQYSSFELAAHNAKALTLRNTLRWQLQAEQAGTENLRLDYATGGLAWQAEYLLRLDSPEAECTMHFTGVAQVANRSGLDYPASRLTLVAGRPNQARDMAHARAAKYSDYAPPPPMAADTAELMAESVPEPQAAGEYHAYPLPQTVDLPDASIQRVPLLEPREKVSCQRLYHAGNSIQHSRITRPQTTPGSGEEVLPVSALLEFDNDSDSGLGLPLPAGRVRLFEQEALLGEARLRHSFNGQKAIRLALGQPFDLHATRSWQESRLADDALSMTDSIKLSLNNAKNHPVTVRIHEPVTRWRDWEIIQSSQSWERINAQTIAFDVTIPAGERIEVSYSVRYRWPASLLKS